MATMEPIWCRARNDLIIEDSRGQKHVYLWEHSARVSRTAYLLARLPGITTRPVDMVAVVAAGFYHDAGWVVQYRDGSASQTEILSRATSDLQRELGAALLESRLADLMKPNSLDTAATCIRRLNDRHVAIPEAQILADASGLDEIGLLSFWLFVRRCSGEGRGVQAALDMWQRQKEYHFWEARISDAFRLEPVRQLARQRLAVFGDFMDELARQHRGQDVGQLADVGSDFVEKSIPLLI
jgi:hypothetical protein